MAKKRKGNESKSKRIGHKPKLQPDAKTCAQIVELAKIQCTQGEAASELGVCESTFNKFLESHEQARRAWKRGRPEGRVALRRMQWESAERGSTQMQMWLGKQLLGQTDKVEQQVSSGAGGPVQIVISSAEAAL
jgi:hypothetical protein